MKFAMLDGVEKLGRGWGKVIMGTYCKERCGKLPNDSYADKATILEIIFV